MTELDNLFGPNSGYVQELYKLFLLDEALVGEQWQSYFRSLNGSASQFAASTAPTPSVSSTTGRSRDRGFLTSRAQRFLDCVRQFGHLSAKINPLSTGIVHLPVPESVRVETYNFSDGELASIVPCDGMAGKAELPLAELIEETRKRYQSVVGFEYWHIPHDEERQWIRQRIEEPPVIFTSTVEEQRYRLKKLVEAENLESGLHTRYIGAKRFSIEGGETLIPMLSTLLGYGADSGVTDVVFGMAHRGRLNVLANVLGKDLEDIFAEFEDKTAATVVGEGDVKYHIGFFGEVPVSSQKFVRARLCPNPSHLEFVNPVVAGAARAIQDYEHESNTCEVMPILIHGDAAMIGQGVVAETLNFSQVNGYSCGGTVHFVINNQLGFTSTPDEARSSSYATDLAKGFGIPVFHVNSEAIDEACEVVKIACDYRQKFKKDVVIDLICYRKYGHNEGDDPSFTQPAMYSEIRKKQPLSVMYNSTLVSSGMIQPDVYEKLKADYVEMFNSLHQEVADVTVGEACGLSGKLSPTKVALSTSVSFERLMEVAQSLVSFPEEFKPHPKLEKLMQRRVKSLEEGTELDWGCAEALAFGSLLLDGVDIRLSGQDSCRGTFSQRHIVYDHYGPDPYNCTDGRLFPLRSLNTPARFEVYNSTLSEAGVLGFEYGYASVAQGALVMWEAQFGDFCNGAQVIIDQFIAASESKWNERSGIVLLLPHGYEGQGPEHSSARLERFLQLCAGGNMTVCYPSTSGQYFHMLRRQALMDVKRPLVVMTPKSLLRLPEASSKPDALTEGSFSTVIETEFPGKGNVVAFCSGKVYYDALRGLKEANAEGISLVRLEQLYPFPTEEIVKLLRKLKPKVALWVQEEPQNMGAWTYVEPHLRGLLGVSPRYVGRPESPTTATGSPKFHLREQGQIIRDLLKHLENHAAVTEKKATGPKSKQRR